MPDADLRQRAREAATRLSVVAGKPEFAEAVVKAPRWRRAELFAAWAALTAEITRSQLVLQEVAGPVADTGARPAGFRQPRDGAGHFISSKTNKHTEEN